MFIITQTTHFSTTKIKIKTIFMTSILFFLFVPTIEQSSTCAFLKQKYPRFLFEKMPDEPRKVNDLTFCQSNIPTCCTAKIEKEFSILAETEFNQNVRSQIKLIHQFFSNSAINFKTHFKEAFNNSMAALRRIFRRTYGQFYIQNKQIFNKFVNDSMNVFEQENGCFIESLQQLFKRIFLEEFYFLNPLHTIDKENNEKQQILNCISSLFPVLRPFGFGPESIVQLTGRAFRIWSSTILALEQISSHLQILEKNFSSPKSCLPQLTRMRHCGICSSGDASFQNGPCPSLCQKVYKQCINELIILDEQWRIFINILIEISNYLLVHNPYIVFRPLPAQISDSIMYYQERGEIISNQVIFRCFGERFEKLANKREKRQSEETGREKQQKSVREETSLCNYSTRKTKKLNYVNFKTFNLKARTIKIAVEQFKDRLLSIRGMWNLFPRLICREGGIQAKIGVKCWNGGDFYFNELKIKISENETIEGNKSVAEKTKLQIQKTVENLVEQNEELYLLIAIKHKNADSNEENINDDDYLNLWNNENFERFDGRRNWATNKFYKINILIFNVILIIFVNFRFL